MWTLDVLRLLCDNDGNYSYYLLVLRRLYLHERWSQYSSVSVQPSSNWFVGSACCWRSHLARRDSLVTGVNTYCVLGNSKERQTGWTHYLRNRIKVHLTRSSYPAVAFLSLEEPRPILQRGKFGTPILPSHWRKYCLLLDWKARHDTNFISRNL